MKNKIRGVLFKNIEEMFAGVDKYGIYPTSKFFENTTAKLLELMREIVPKKKETIFHDGYSDVGEGFNQCQEEMLKKLEG